VNRFKLLVAREFERPPRLLFGTVLKQFDFATGS